MITVPKMKSLNAIGRIKVPVPANAGSLWQCTEHRDAIDTIHDALEKRKWKILREQWALSSNEANLAASFDVRVPGLKPPPLHDYSIGVMTNNERRRPLTFFVGVDTNPHQIPIVLGTLENPKRVTTAMVLRDEIEAALDAFLEKAPGAQDAIDAMDRYYLKKGEAEVLLFEACRKHPYNGRFPWGKLGQVDECRDRENVKETSYSLALAFAKACRTCPAYMQMVQLNAFRELLPTQEQAVKTEI